jgi:hypothetical protein
LIKNEKNQIVKIHFMSKKFKILILAGIVVLFFFSLYLALRSGDTNTQTPVENTVILQGKGGAGAV